LENLQFHSLTDLLIELMQLKVSYQLKQETSEDNDDGTEPSSLNVSHSIDLSEDQEKMQAVLKFKQFMVISKLLGSLSQTNFNDIEKSLNAMTVIIELIEIPTTLDLFFVNDGKMISKMMELAIDPTNGFNQ
jgi:hypothetical protein